MRLTLAVRSALMTPAAPLEKFNIVGTRPKADSAKNAMTAPKLVGSMIPTASPGAVPLRSA